MPLAKNKTYCSIPFSNESPKHDFYVYSSVASLATKTRLSLEESYKCRTIGILHSSHGKFYMTDLDTPSLKEGKIVIRVSMIYTSSPPQSTVKPYPVQMFGTLHWKNRPVIFASLLQVLSAPLALRIKAAMTTVTENHLARAVEDEDIFEDN